MDYVPRFVINAFAFEVGKEEPNKAIYNRPAVKKGLTVPSDVKNGAGTYLQRPRDEFRFKESEDKLRKLAGDAKEQCGYKFASP
ncbi:hypothetical protein BJ878DRAFT_544089 [Calycina marina]|uniref:Uncharacterized protein n=1 Tax=Calycina marina TaxID=1763456 RepID=A0A9P8CDI0_9HELO|nr:hypothetical protein BJ878DRAFT_544089 [Calycina marina]